MDSQILFAISVLSSFISFTIIAKWFLAPRLRSMPRSTALIVLLLIHTFRTIGLAFLVPQVTGAPLPFAFAAPAAFGDLLAVVLAFISLLALRLKWPLASLIVWIFNIVGLIDLLFAYIEGGIFAFPTLMVGTTWFIPTFCVPFLLVSHILIFWLLLSSPSSQKKDESIASLS